MIDVLIHHDSYHTVLNDKRNGVLVLICNADLAQHTNHCKKISYIHVLKNDDGRDQP